MSKKVRKNDLMCAKFLRKIILEKVTYILVQNAIDEGIVQSYLDLQSELDNARRNGDDELSNEYKEQLENHSFSPIMEILNNDDNFSYDYESYTPNMKNFEDYIDFFTQSSGKKKLRVPSFNGDIEELLEFYVNHIVNIPE